MSTNSLEKRGISGEVSVYDIYKSPLNFSGYYPDESDPDESVPEIVRDAFFMDRESLIKLYYGNPSEDHSMSSRRVMSNLNGCVKELKMPSRFVIAYAQHKNGCKHSRSEINNGDIKRCGCYGIAGQLLGEAEFFIKRSNGKKYVLEGALEDDNESAVEELEVA